MSVITEMVARLIAARASTRAIAIAIETVEIVLREKDNRRIAESTRKAKWRDMRRDSPGTCDGTHPSPPSLSPIPPLLTTPPPTSKIKRSSRSAIALPTDWMPDRQFARAKGMSDRQIDEEAQRFRDHAAAHGRTQVDWKAAWRMWVTSPYRRAGAPPRPGSKEDIREKAHDAFQQLKRFAHSDDGEAGGQPDGDPTGFLPFPKSS